MRIPRRRHPAGIPTEAGMHAGNDGLPWRRKARPRAHRRGGTVLLALFALASPAVPAWAAPVTLRVDIAGAGVGSVTVDGVICAHNGNSPTGCDFSHNSGDVVTLTATAASGHAFTGWGGACPGIAPSCTLTLDTAKTVSAGFSARVLPTIDCLEYLGDINAVRAHFGYVNTTEGDEVIAFGANNFFTPSPPFRSQPTVFQAGVHRQTFSVVFPASSFVEWTLNSLKRRVTLTDTAIPGCAPPVQTHTVSLLLSGPGSGVVSGATASDCGTGDGQTATLCTGTHPANAPLTLNATPAPGHAFSGWRGACAGSGSTCALTVDSDKTVVAGFAGVAAITQIIADPEAAGTLYSAVDGVGIHKSSDGGASWSAATTQPADPHLTALLLADSQTLYATTHSGLFRSTDAGLNWSACPGQPTDTHLLSLTRAANGNLYAGGASGVFVSTDGCASWSAHSNGLPN